MGGVAGLCPLIDQCLPFWFGQSSAFRLHRKELLLLYSWEQKELTVPLQQALWCYWIKHLQSFTGTCVCLDALLNWNHRVTKGSQVRKGRVWMPTSWCYAAFRGVLVQAESYRCCWLIQGKGNSVSYWKRWCVVITITKGSPSVVLVCFFLLSWWTVHQQMISSCQTAMTVTSLISLGIGDGRSWFITHMQL